MSRKKQRKTKHDPGHNSHHLLHYRRWWDKGCKQLLRRAFVYNLPVDVHEKLHAIVEPVPPLDEDDAHWLWVKYREHGGRMDLFEALDWLQLNAPNSEFAIAIMKQSEFLHQHMGRSS